MALYEVERTDLDAVQPGEFVHAVVIAGGKAQARNAVAHLSGVTKTNVTARRMDTADGIHILSTYFDERDPDNSFLPADVV